MPQAVWLRPLRALIVPQTSSYNFHWPTSLFETKMPLFSPAPWTPHTSSASGGSYIISDQTMIIKWEGWVGLGDTISLHQTMSHTSYNKVSVLVRGQNPRADAPETIFTYPCDISHKVSYRASAMVTQKCTHKRLHTYRRAHIHTHFYTTHTHTITHTHIFLETF